jgi:hypothetical protein
LTDEVRRKHEDLRPDQEEGSVAGTHPPSHSCICTSKLPGRYISVVELTANGLGLFPDSDLEGFLEIGFVGIVVLPGLSATF